MYQRALYSYEKALGQEAMKKYIPALTTAKNLACLFQRTGRVWNAEELYSRSLIGVEAIFGRLSIRYKNIVKALNTLKSTDSG